MTPAGIYRKYRGRIRKIMQRIAAALKEAGHKVKGPYAFVDDTYSWALLVNADESGQNGVDVKFTIAESEYWDGEEGGVNFMLDVTEWGGRMLGGLTPYNYTPQVWVDRADAEAVEERFKIMEDAWPGDVVPLVERADEVLSADGIGE